MNGSDTLIYCVEILLDFSLIFCVRYIYFGFLLKANVLLASPSLVISEKCILKERNKYITSFYCEVIFVKISTILSFTMLPFFKDFKVKRFYFFWNSEFHAPCTKTFSPMTYNGQICYNIMVPYFK